LGVRRDPRAATLALALALLAGLAGRARAQSEAPPALEAERRIYDVGPPRVRDDARLESLIADLEAATPERRFFVIFLGAGSPEALARATALSWTRAAAADPRLPWHADASVLVVASARPPEVAALVPAALRDRLGISPFALEKLAGTTFAAPARRGELDAAVEAYVQSLASALDTGARRAEQEKLAILEAEARPATPEVALGPLSDRLAALEDRLRALAHGADLSAVEATLAAARVDLRRAVLALPERADLAETSARRAESECAAAGAVLERVESEWAAVRERVLRLDAEVERLRADPGPLVPLLARELENAGAKLAEARRDVETRTAHAMRTLDEVDAALAKIREQTPPAPVVHDQTPPRSGLSWRGLLAGVLAVLVFGLVGFALVLRETRAQASEGFLVRREQVERDAAELHAALETLRERRDRVAHPPRVELPLELAKEYGLAGGEPTDAKGGSTVLPAAPAFAGETARLLERANGAIGDLGAAWDSAESALADAEGRALRATAFGCAAFLEARDVLDLAPARVDLEPRVELAGALLDQLAGVAELARDALSGGRTELARATEALDSAVSSGLAPAPFEDDLAQVHDLARDAVFAATADPVRAVSLAGSIVAQATRLRAAVERAETVRAEMARLGEQAARLGAQVGGRGTSGEDDPTFGRDRALASLAEAETALDFGVLDEAEKELTRAREQLAHAEEALAKKADGSATGPLDERRAEAREARESLVRARAALGALEADFARPSWEEVAPPLEAAERTLPSLEAELEAAASAKDETLRGGRTRIRLLKLDAHLTEVRRAASAAEHRLVRLREARSALGRRAEELERHLREVESLAKDDGGVALRSATVARLEEVRAAVGSAGALARAPGERPDLPRILHDLDALDLDLEELRLEIARDGFLCRRALAARHAAEQAVRFAEDARRRYRDRPAARHRETRAREVLERTGPLLARPEMEWPVVLEAYTSSIRAARAARELASRKESPGSDVRHALREARRALRGAETFDALFVRADAEPGQVLLRRSLEAAAAGDDGQAVEHAERAAGAADEARRAALGRALSEERAAQTKIREGARVQRQARERLERQRLLAESQRRAVWIGVRFGPAQRTLSFDESSAALKSVQV
jgi:hypothetical protein